MSTEEFETVQFDRQEQEDEMNKAAAEDAEEDQDEGSIQKPPKKRAARP